MFLDAPASFKTMLVGVGGSSQMIAILHRGAQVFSREFKGWHLQWGNISLTATEISIPMKCCKKTAL